MLENLDDITEQDLDDLIEDTIMDAESRFNCPHLTTIDGCKLGSWCEHSGDHQFCPKFREAAK